MANSRGGPRGLDPGLIVEAAVQLLEAEGEAGFSVRKVAGRVGCDPMAVLYHFGSKHGLERSIVDWLAAQVTLPNLTEPWDKRLMAVAIEYRRLALRYPNAFPLLLRFWTAGPFDLRLAEYGYACFSEAGHADDAVVDLCLGWYAAILGMAAAAAGGLLSPPLEVSQTLDDLDPAEFPVTSRLRSSLETQAERAVYEGFSVFLLRAIALPDSVTRTARSK